MDVKTTGMNKLNLEVKQSVKKFLMLRTVIKLIMLLLMFVQVSNLQASGGFLLKNKNVCEGPLSVFVKQESTRPPGEEHFFQKGAVSRLVFTIENISDNFMIIRNFGIQDQLPDIYRWYGSVYGGAEYMHLEDVWIFSELEHRLSEPLFTMGVIYPGGKLNVTRYVILRENKINIMLRYQKLSKEEAERSLYFNLRGKEEFGAHRKYEHCKNIDSIPVEDIDWDTAVFPEAHKILIEKQVYSCHVSLRDPEFSLKNAEDRIGLKAETFVYWKRQRAWVIENDRNRYMISQDEILKLPEIDLLSFIIIESAYKTTNFILPMSGYDQFNAVQPKMEGPGYFNPGITPLKDDEILSLFKFAREKGDSISVFAYDPTGLGKRYYLLVGDFNEKKRRDIVGKKR